MIDFEFHIISKVLEGNHSSFSLLYKQIKHLKAICRKRELGRYLVEFEPSDEKIKLLTGSLSAIAIEDTLLSVEESPVLFHASLTVLDGYIRWLFVDGEYDFKIPFTIKEFFWFDASLSDNKSDSVITDPNLRNYDLAVGYIPTYR